MEKRIVKKCEEHVSLFKDEIKNWIEENQITMEGKQNTSEFLKFIYEKLSKYKVDTENNFLIECI